MALIGGNTPWDNASGGWEDFSNAWESQIFQEAVELRNLSGVSSLSKLVSAPAATLGSRSFVNTDYTNAVFQVSSGLKMFSNFNWDVGAMYEISAILKASSDINSSSNQTSFVTGFLGVNSSILVNEFNFLKRSLVIGSKSDFGSSNKVEWFVNPVVGMESGFGYEATSFLDVQVEFKTWNLLGYEQINFMEESLEFTSFSYLDNSFYNKLVRDFVFETKSGFTKKNTHINNLDVTLESFSVFSSDDDPVFFESVRFNGKSTLDYNYLYSVMISVTLAGYSSFDYNTDWTFKEYPVLAGVNGLEVTPLGWGRDVPSLGNWSTDNPPEGNADDWF